MNDYKLKILRNERVGDGIYEMLLTRPEGVDPKGAQFIHIKLKNGSRILRRPFCICDCAESGILICYAAVGEGTKELASYAAGEEVEAVLPLGNGWSADDWKNPVLLGGGMGSAVLPLVARLAKRRSPRHIWDMRIRAEWCLTNLCKVFVLPWSPPMTEVSAERDISPIFWRRT